MSTGEPRRSSNTVLGTVVILNWNGIDYIEEVLKAVFAQTVIQHLRVVVVDQNSSDGSRGPVTR